MLNLAMLEARLRGWPVRAEDAELAPALTWSIGMQSALKHANSSVFHGKSTTYVVWYYPAHGWFIKQERADALE